MMFLIFRVLAIINLLTGFVRMLEGGHYWWGLLLWIAGIICWRISNYFRH